MGWVIVTIIVPCKPIEKVLADDIVSQLVCPPRAMAMAMTRWVWMAVWTMMVIRAAALKRGRAGSKQSESSAKDGEELEHLCSRSFEVCKGL